MILLLIGTSGLCLIGWYSATRRVHALQRQVDAYLGETWHSAEEMAEFAGRCAWHDYVSTGDVPPIVEDHLAPNFKAGFDDESSADLAAAEAGIMAALADGSLRLRA